MKLLLTSLPLLLVLAGLVYRGAIAEDTINEHDVEIEQLKTSTAALLEINLKNEAAKAAEMAQREELCRAGVPSRQWCANRGLPHPKDSPRQDR